MTSSDNRWRQSSSALTEGSAQGESRLSTGEREDYQDALAEIERLRALAYGRMVKAEDFDRCKDALQLCRDTLALHRLMIPAKECDEALNAADAILSPPDIQDQPAGEKS